MLAARWLMAMARRRRRRIRGRTRLRLRRRRLRKGLRLLRLLRVLLLLLNGCIHWAVSSKDGDTNLASGTSAVLFLVDMVVFEQLSKQGRLG